MPMPAPWIAGKNTFYGKIRSFEGSVFLNSLHPVLRTGGSVTTGIGEIWGNGVLIQPHQVERDKYCYVSKQFLQWIQGGWLLHYKYPCKVLFLSQYRK